MLPDSSSGLGLCELVPHQREQALRKDFSLRGLTQLQLECVSRWRLRGALRALALLIRHRRDGGDGPRVRLLVRLLQSSQQAISRGASVRTPIALRPAAVWLQRGLYQGRWSWSVHGDAPYPFEPNVPGWWAQESHDELAEGMFRMLLSDDSGAEHDKGVWCLSSRWVKNKHIVVTCVGAPKHCVDALGGFKSQLTQPELCPSSPEEARFGAPQYLEVAQLLQPKEQEPEEHHAAEEATHNAAENDMDDFAKETPNKVAKEVTDAYPCHSCAAVFKNPLILRRHMAALHMDCLEECIA